MQSTSTSCWAVALLLSYTSTPLARLLSPTVSLRDSIPSMGANIAPLGGTEILRDLLNIGPDLGYQAWVNCYDEQVVSKKLGPNDDLEVTVLTTSLILPWTWIPGRQMPGLSRPFRTQLAKPSATAPASGNRQTSVSP